MQMNEFSNPVYQPVDHMTVSQKYSTIFNSTTPITLTNLPKIQQNELESRPSAQFCKQQNGQDIQVDLRATVIDKKYVACNIF